MNARSEFIAKWVFDRKGFVIGTERKEDLIRCKDCKWFDKNEDECFLSGFDTDGYEFCSWAERKEDETL